MGAEMKIIQGQVQDALSENGAIDVEKTLIDFLESLLKEKEA
jgi:hypothetical protein